MSDSLKTLIDSISDVRSNPVAIQKAVLSSLETTIEGEYDVVDPSNPFIFALESAVAGAAANFERMEALSRKQYPTLAQTAEDLYHHMSDADYRDRFAIPAKDVPFTLLLGVDEIYEKSIESDNGSRKMVIPRETMFTIEDIDFVLHYPIEIRTMAHGGLQVVWDVDRLSPLKSIETNVLDWQIIRMPSETEGLGNIDLLMIEIPADQLTLLTYYDQLNEATGFKKTFSFTDQFYYARVYVSLGDEGEWEEIHVTHSDQVYDPLTPTAKISITANQLSIHIPQIYFTTDLLERGVRIDIYTTKGEGSLILERFEPSEFSVVWNDLDRYPSELVEPIRSFSNYTLFSTGRIIGGMDEMSFEDLRDRVITNSLGDVVVPITSSQLSSTLDLMDYRIVKEVDNITNRTYLATKSLPIPNTDLVSSAVGCMMMTFQSSFNKLNGSRWVKEHHQRLTIASGALFSTNDGILSLLSNEQYDTLAAMSNENKAAYLISNRLVYTPYHYVLDATDDAFAIRAYYLDKPTTSADQLGIGVYSKTFVAENESAQLEIATLRYGISRTDDGYKLVIITRTGPVLRDFASDRIHAQLSYIPEGEVDRAYLNGEHVGLTEDDEFIIEFNVDTDFDIDEDDQIQMNSFRMYSDTDLTIPAPLRGIYDLVYMVSDYDLPNLVGTSLDDLQGKFMLPDDTVSVVHEKLDISFGMSLPGLWRRARSVAGTAVYLKYEEDVPATYERNIYVRDELTGAINMEYNEETQEIEYELLHAAGDAIYDLDGNPVYQHLKGDIKMDAYDQPIIVDDRVIERQMDLLLFDGIFKLVTDSVAIKYAKETTEEVVRWIRNELDALSGRLLENTDLWFYPQTTLGQITATIEDGVEARIDSEQSLNVRFYLTRLAYNSLELRDNLGDVAVEVIRTMLDSDAISVTAIASAIKAKTGEDVIDVTVSGLGGDYDYDMLSLSDSSERINIKKRPTVLADNTLTVQDDIVIEYVRHKDE